MPGFQENLDRPPPNREQFVEPLWVVVPQRAQRHAADDTQRQRHDIGRQRRRNAARGERLGPSRLNRPAGFAGNQRVERSLCLHLLSSAARRLTDMEVVELDEVVHDLVRVSSPPSLLRTHLALRELG